MEPFKTHTGIAAILNRGNIDTDQIISKEFLKSIKRTGFGDQLFFHWKHLPDGAVDPNFSLNDPDYKGASILVTGNNFGCGSSREHAVWAIVQYGFKVILAPVNKKDGQIIPGFADIFANNSKKNGLLLIELSENEIKEILQTVESTKPCKMTVDLANQSIKSGNSEYKFDIDSGTKTRFLEGLDDIGITEKFAENIKRFEKSHRDQINW